MLYLITNRNLVKEGSYLNVIKQAVMGGIDAIILREKDLTYNELMPIALKIKEMVENTKVLLIVNSNFEVARDVYAHGYHLGFEDFFKEKPKFNGLLGVSVHSLDEAVLAEKNGASYLIVSHIFETNSKKGLKHKGTDFIRDIKRSVNVPIIALGGIKPENIKEVYEAGADGVAVMSYIMASQNPFLATKKLKCR